MLALQAALADDGCMPKMHSGCTAQATPCSPAEAAPHACGQLLGSHIARFCLHRSEDSHDSWHVQRLKEMEVSIIEDRGGDLGKNFDPVKQGDVVILPAFGASVPELRLLSDRKVQVRLAQADVCC